MDTSTQFLLRQVPILAGLDSEGIASLAAHCRRRRFRVAEALFHEGDPGHSLYVIVSGRVNIQKTTGSGEIVHLAVRGPGEQFGELSLIDGKPRMADAITAEPCDLLILDRAGFLLAIEESPRIALSVMASLADRLRGAADQQESQQGLNVVGRLAELMLTLMASHGVEQPDGSIRIDARISQQEMADRIGTARETVNRALASLKSVGGIRMEGRTFIVTDAARLRRLAAR